jgi:hypothetical protein
MGKMFQNASSLKPLGELKPNCPGMIIGRSSVFYADRKSKMAATTGHSAEISLHPILYKSAFICLEGLQYLLVQQILMCNQRLSRACGCYQKFID